MKCSCLYAEYPQLLVAFVYSAPLLFIYRINNNKLKIRVSFSSQENLPPFNNKINNFLIAL